MTAFKWQSLVFAWRYAARRGTAAAEAFANLLIERFQSPGITDAERHHIVQQFCNVDFRKGGEAYDVLSPKWKSVWETMRAWSAAYSTPR